MPLHDAGRAHVERALEDAEATNADAADSNPHRRGRIYWSTTDADPTSTEGWIDVGTTTDDGITFGFDGDPALSAVTLRNGDTLTVTHHVEQSDDPVTVTLRAGPPARVDHFIRDMLDRYAGESPGWWLPPQLAGVLNLPGQQHPAPTPEPRTGVRGGAATGQTPGQSGTGGVVDDIDAATEGRCACGCGATIGDDSPSAYYATQDCQRRYLSARATNAQEVYSQEDAASVLVGMDHVPVPLGDGQPDPYGFGALRETMVGVADAVPVLRAQMSAALLGNYRRHFDARPAVRWMDTADGILEVLRYRRFCPHCNARRVPDMYQEDGPEFANFGRRRSRPMRHERQRCSSCRHTWPGPPYLASFDTDIRTDPIRYALRLQRGRWATEAFVSRDFMAALDAPRDYADGAWERLERELWQEQHGGRRAR